jgi:hypothetical protein
MQVHGLPQKVKSVLYLVTDLASISMRVGFACV